MSKQSDWFPRNRAEQLAMADNWITVCTTRQTAWNIPSPALTDLTTFRNAARTALETAQNETTRTPAKRLCLLAWSLAA